MWYIHVMNNYVIGCVEDMYGFDLMPSLAYNAREI